MKKGNSIRMNVMLDKDDLALLDYECDRRGVSRSSMLRYLIKSFLRFEDSSVGSPLPPNVGDGVGVPTMPMDSYNANKVTF